AHLERKRHWRCANARRPEPGGIRCLRNRRRRLRNPGRARARQRTPCLDCGVETGMRLSATIVGDLGRIMAEEVKAAEKAVTAGVGEAAEGLKADLRTQITNAGLGPRLARTW